VGWLHTTHDGDVHSPSGGGVLQAGRSLLSGTLYTRLWYALVMRPLFKLQAPAPLPGENFSLHALYATVCFSQCYFPDCSVFLCVLLKLQGRLKGNLKRADGGSGSV
jgi:hypothetical protein